MLSILWCVHEGADSGCTALDGLDDTHFASHLDDWLGLRRALLLSKCLLLCSCSTVHFFANSDKAKRDLGWKPKHNFLKDVDTQVCD